MPVSVKNNLPGMGFNSDLDQLQTSQMAPPASQQPLREHFEFDHDSEEDAPPNRFSSRQTHHHQHTASSSRIGEHGSPKSNPLEDAAPGGVIIHSAGEGNKSRWSHIDDLDSFFIRVYNYHQKHGFKVMVLEVSQD